MSGTHIRELDYIFKARIPAFDEPEDCARAMAALIKYGHSRRPG